MTRDSLKAMGRGIGTVEGGRDRNRNRDREREREGGIKSKDDGTSLKLTLHRENLYIKLYQRST